MKSFFSTEKRYSVVYADPPWSFRFSSPTAAPRPVTCQEAAGVSYYYDTMSLEDIKKMPVSSLCEKDAVLFLWATTPLLPEAFEVMKSWGFKYKTMITWHKLRCKGMGYWFRGHTEHLLLGVRGNVKAFKSMQHNIVKHRVLKHSEKPEVFRKIIESVTQGERVELFARIRKEGWDAWGNQLPPETQMTIEVTE